MPGTHPASLRNHVDRVGEHRLGKAVQCEAMGLRVAGADEHVGGVLELVPLLELWLDPQFVERAANKGGFDPHAEHSETAAGL